MVRDPLSAGSCSLCCWWSSLPSCTPSTILHSLYHPGLYTRLHCVHHSALSVSSCILYHPIPLYHPALSPGQGHLFCKQIHQNHNTEQANHRSVNSSVSTVKHYSSTVHIQYTYVIKTDMADGVQTTQRNKAYHGKAASVFAIFLTPL